MRSRIYFSLLGLLLLLAANACDPKPNPEATPVRTPTTAPTPVVGVVFETITPGPFSSPRLTSTPPPMATAAPSATPFLYTVETGDTLLAIAINHNTTVDTILVLNPGIQPELLQIGQSLVLPIQATPISPESMEAELLAKIEVTDLSAYESPSGGLWILGEVANLSEQHFEDVRLNLRIADDAGNTITTVPVLARAGILLAGGSAPFGHLLNGTPPEFDDVQATVIGGQPVSNLGNRYLDLAASEARVTIEDEWARLTARISNIGQRGARQLAVVVTLYDADGHVIGFNEARLDGTLAAGGDRLVSLDLAPLGDELVDYTIVVQGLTAEEE